LIRGVLKVLGDMAEVELLEIFGGLFGQEDGFAEKAVARAVARGDGLALFGDGAA